MFLITITSSFSSMETQVVPQINTIKPSGQLLYLYSTPITLLIKGNNHQNTFQVVCVNVCVGGQGAKGGERRGSIYFYIPTTSDFFNSFHITYRLVLPHSPTRGPNPHTKGEDYRKSGKTKLITGGISTSQCCLKCNYMGLELWLRLGWLQISHWQTCSGRKIWLPLKTTAGESVWARAKEIGIMSQSSTPQKVKQTRKAPLPLSVD